VLAGVNALENFFAVYFNIFRRLDADSDLVSLYAQDRHRDIITNDERFADSARQNKHV